MDTIFFDQQSKLRSGWRAAIFIVAFVLISMAASLLILAVLKGLRIDPAANTHVLMLLNGFASLLAALGLGGACARHLEDLPFRSLGAALTDNWGRHLVFGLSIGGFTLGLAVLIVSFFGGLRFEVNTGTGPAAIITSLAGALALFAVAAAFEEALFRGYLLQTLARAGLAWLAVVLTSLFFGFVHLNNPNATMISTLNTVLAGVWFSLAYLRTRDLWFVWGIHLMWNWMQGAVFGIEVSGLPSLVTTPLLREIDAGPQWLTGENYGIEGSVACTAAILISMVAVHFLPNVRPDAELLAMTSDMSRVAVGGDPK